MAPKIIKFGDNEVSANEFLQIAGIPNVIGCIDGTSIKGICDVRKRFIDVFTGIPAKIHDARVLKLSDINDDLRRICDRKFHILGDAAYPIREWLLIPYRDYGNLSDKQRQFNKQFCATRVLIENAFGLLKNRFRQLTELDLHSVDKISKFIISCCVLHNFCIDNNDFFIFNDGIELDNQEPNYEDRGEQETLLRRLGEIKRDHLLNVLFP
ncbi:PREDICTED: putative nuclease HARBI1 isoform X2 [Vollenhovia emeryi]|uniref:putative nuclease HARBI1 isoform X2 n=1 Tax=Vollenhovia emeryi TaxID=411798 RepID=UPI0005F3D584|nr:PREDICTED: putative nuclease HARBI1 isoform X2 [Vollenhovia emeryi]